MVEWLQYLLQYPPPLPPPLFFHSLSLSLSTEELQSANPLTPSHQLFN